jgi:hypothetical protein
MKVAPPLTLSLNGGVRILAVLTVAVLVTILIASVPFLWVYEPDKSDR